MSTKTHSKRAAKWTLVVAGAALFMTALDQLVVGVALHSIRARPRRLDRGRSNGP